MPKNNRDKPPQIIEYSISRQEISSPVFSRDPLKINSHIVSRPAIFGPFTHTVVIEAEGQDGMVRALRQAADWVEGNKGMEPMISESYWEDKRNRNGIQE